MTRKIECPVEGELLDAPDLATVPATEDQMDADDWRELNGWLYRSLGDQRGDAPDLAIEESSPCKR